MTLGARHRHVRVVLYVLLLIGLIPMLLPFAWMVSSAVKPLPEVIRIPPTWVPESPTLQNFDVVFRRFPFGRYFLNSVVVATVVVATVVLTSAMAGYAFSKFELPGREILFVAMLTDLMVPFQIRMIPLFLMASWLHLTDTLAGVSLPWLFDASGIFLMRQFIRTIPGELLEAARVEGASEPAIFFRVVLPLCGSVLAALAVITLVGNWEEFLWPLIVTSSDASRTLPVGLQGFSEQYMSHIHWQMAGATIAAAPLILAFLIFQRHFVEGIASTLRP